MWQVMGFDNDTHLKKQGYILDGALWDGLRSSPHYLVRLYAIYFGMSTFISVSCSTLIWNIIVFIISIGIFWMSTQKVI